MKFLTAAALAPLAIASAAHAETVISSKRTTPIATATANNGNPDSITIEDSGSIALTSGTAVTVNSNHDVNLKGGIVFEDAASGSTGILVAAGGATSDITIDGGITLDDGYTPTDGDKDGDLDGDWAEGSDRRGLWVAGPLVGDIVMTQEGFLVVEGNASYGIDIDGNVTGDFLADGRTNVTGDNSYGIRATGDISGDVRIGDVTAIGKDTTGVSLEGDIGGGLVFDGTITATGFRSTQRVTDEEYLENQDADDIRDGGSAIVIAGNVNGGVLFERTQVDNDEDDDDEDNDGVDDAEETTAQISAFGSSPAIQVGSTTQTVTLGAVGTGDKAYGFIMRGNVTASGVWDNFNATAIEIGVDGGLGVDIFGGLRFTEGTVTAVAFEANATALRINGNTTVPLIYNDSAFSATVVSETDTDKAQAILLEAGSNTTRFDNYGSVAGSVIGNKASAYAIVDKSGNLGTINNYGVIQATVTATDSDDNGTTETASGKAVAIDLSANTLGALILQNGINDGDDLGDGKDDADADGDGVDDNDEPGIVGEIRLGSGSDVIDVRNGAIFGDINFGAGSDSLLISGGAQVRGQFTDADGTLAVTVTKGTIESTSTDVTNIGSLDVAGDGNLVVTIDPSKDATGFNVSGTATLADGAGLGVRFSNLIGYTQESEKFTILQAGDLTVGDLDLSALEENTPYLYVATARQEGDELILEVAIRTPEQAGFIASEAAAFASIYDALSEDDGLRNSALSRLSREDFMQLYRQLLPEHSGGPLLSLEAGIDAVRHALADRTVQAPEGEITAWLQEINFYADKQRNQSYAFRAEGFGVAGGLERGGRRGNLGLSFAYTSSDLKDRMAVRDEILTSQLWELGAYYRLNRGDWRLWGRAAAGYAMFDGTREVILSGLQRSYDADYDGYSLSAGAGASYDFRWRKWYGRAEGSVEYFSLMENGYCEGDSKNAAGGLEPGYCIDDRDGHIFKAEATLNIGRRFGEETWFTPEFRIGYRQNISAEIGATTARGNYVGSIPFTLFADAIEGGGPVLGFRLMAGSGMGFLGIEGNAVLIDDYELYDLMIRGGFRF